MTNNLLIIGGMGPQASLRLHKLIIDESAKLGAKNNDEYPGIVHISIPVPDFINNTVNKNKAQSMLVKSLRPLRGYKFDNAVIACNTAHLLLKEVEAVLGIKPLSLINEAVEELKNKNVSKVGLLASQTTIKSRLYEDPLSKLGIQTIILPGNLQAKIETIIQSVIANQAKADNCKNLISCTQILKGLGAQKIILGCTELSVTANGYESNDTIDPLALMAKKILKT